MNKEQDFGQWMGDQISNISKAAAYDVLVEENVRLKEALEHLVHLHLCEQEGLLSGKPTPEMWLKAVDKASEVLNYQNY